MNKDKEWFKEKNNGKLVMAGVPIYASNYFPEFAKSYWSAVSKGKFYKLSNMNGDSLITRARNNLAHEFLQSDAEYLMFMDSDLEFDNQHLDWLYSHDKPIVCGMYPKKQLKLGWVMSGGDEAIRKEEGYLLRVQEAGTGFMLIRRDVFEAMREATPEDAYKCDTNKDIRHDFFKVGVFKGSEEQEYGRYLSEDWYFCHMARKLGFHTWVDTRIALNHIGQFKYPATEAELRESLDVYTEAREWASNKAE